MNNLFDEFLIKNIKAKNRVVMPPMVCFGWAGDDGCITPKHISHYYQRSSGGAGMIIVEALCVSHNGRLSDNQLGIYSDAHIPGLKKITDRCHENDTVMLCQIHHAGSKTSPKSSSDIIAPSDIFSVSKKARALTSDEIREIRRMFTDAAIRAKKAGFDGIELHGAHGYLLDQFASPLTNQRTDDYGGFITNRMRLACETIRDIRIKTGDDFIIGYRMGGCEPSIDNGIKIAGILEEAGVDILHVSAGISDGSKLEPPEDFKFNSIVYAGTVIRKNVNIPVIVVNGIRKPDEASYLIENDMADFVAIGRGLLSDPDWPKKAQAGLNPVYCEECKRCRWFTNGYECPANIKLRAVDSDC